jgi:hypothetical protein
MQMIRFTLTNLAARLVLSLASLTLPVTAAPLDPPPGSYQATCVQIIVQRLIGGSGRSLEARCPNRNGQYVDAALGLPCQGDVQNQNGRLRCVPGANPFAPPRGSYQTRCRDIQLAGPILSAQCSTIIGVLSAETSINTLNCKGRDIRVNARGALVC